MKKNKKKSVNDKLEYLRKQRSGEAEGGYYLALEETFKYIEKKISESRTDYCNPTFYEIGVAIYGGGRRTMVMKFLDELVYLGNISIEGKGADRQVRILKPLEF